MISETNKLLVPLTGMFTRNPQSANRRSAHPFSDYVLEYPLPPPFLFVVCLLHYLERKSNHSHVLYNQCRGMFNMFEGYSVDVALGSDTQLGIQVGPDSNRCISFNIQRE